MAAAVAAARPAAGFAVAARAHLHRVTTSLQVGVKHKLGQDARQRLAGLVRLQKIFANAGAEQFASAHEGSAIGTKAFDGVQLLARRRRRQRWRRRRRRVEEREQQVLEPGPSRRAPTPACPKRIAYRGARGVGVGEADELDEDVLVGAAPDPSPPRSRRPPPRAGRCGTPAAACRRPAASHSDCCALGVLAHPLPRVRRAREPILLAAERAGVATIARAATFQQLDDASGAIGELGGVLARSASRRRRAGEAVIMTDERAAQRAAPAEPPVRPGAEACAAPSRADALGAERAGGEDGDGTRCAAVASSAGGPRCRAGVAEIAASCGSAASRSASVAKAVENARAVAAAAGTAAHAAATAVRAAVAGVSAGGARHRNVAGVAAPAAGGGGRRGRRRGGGAPLASRDDELARSGSNTNSVRRRSTRACRIDSRTPPESSPTPAPQHLHAHERGAIGTHPSTAACSSPRSAAPDAVGGGGGGSGGSRNASSRSSSLPPISPRTADASVPSASRTVPQRARGGGVGEADQLDEDVLVGATESRRVELPRRCAAGARPPRATPPARARRAAVPALTSAAKRAPPRVDERRERRSRCASLRAPPPPAAPQRVAERARQRPTRRAALANLRRRPGAAMGRRRRPAAPLLCARAAARAPPRAARPS